MLELVAMGPATIEQGRGEIASCPVFQPARLKRHNFLSPSLTVAMIYLAVVVVLCVCVFASVSSSASEQTDGGVLSV